MDDFDTSDAPAEKERPKGAGVNAVHTAALKPEQLADQAIVEAMEHAAVKLSLPEMVYAIDTEVHRIEGEQRARILAGLLVAPVEEQMQRAARLQSVMNFLTACSERPAEAAERFARIAKARSGNV